MSLMTALVHVWGTVYKVKKNLEGHLAREQCKPSDKQEIDKLENARSPRENKYFAENCK